MRSEKTLSSYRLAKIMKMRYQIMRITPYFLSNFQPLRCVATMRKTTVENRERVEYSSPGEEWR